MLISLDQRLQEKWHLEGLDQPTEIQEQLFGRVFESQSMIAISPTGSGKTLAYLLPLLSKIIPGQGLQGIVLAPSQELVMQIVNEARKWTKDMDITVQPILGSVNMKRQIEGLKRNPELIIGSTGRLLEIVRQSKKLKLQNVNYLVLDEADYLMEDEQAKAVNELLNRLDPKVNKVYVSATLTPDLQALVEKFPNQFQLIKVGNTVLDNLDHIAIMTQNRQKHQMLRRLSHIEGMQAMVFFDKVGDLEQIQLKLSHDGVKAASLHSKLHKQDREIALRDFKLGKLTYLLTTDVGARGLDIDNLPAVIHYQRISDARTYIHRSGRTGRMGKEGLVISLVNEQELRDLSKILSANQIEISVKEYYQGQLVDPRLKAELRGAQVEQQVKNKPRNQGGSDKKTNKSSVKTNPVKKKKDRKRDRLNKGKPKKFDRKGDA